MTYPVTLEDRPTPTRDQLIQSDLTMQLAQAQLTIAQLRADITGLRAVNTDLEGQLQDASDRA